MSLPLEQYVIVKDNICISYLGFEDKEILDLVKSLKFLAIKFKDVSFTLALRDEKTHLGGDQKNIVSLSALKANKSSFSIIYELYSNFNSVNRFFDELGIDVDKL